MAEEEKKAEIVPVVTPPSTPQEKVVRLLYKISLVASSSNCECEVCKLAKELSKELSGLI